MSEKTFVNDAPDIMYDKTEVGALFRQMCFKCREAAVKGEHEESIRISNVIKRFEEAFKEFHSH